MKTSVDEAKGKEAKARGGQDRIIHTERHAAYDAGNRHGLPPEIECGDGPQQAWANVHVTQRTWHAR